MRSAKHLLEKCARDGTDTYAALLNLCNTPREGLPSPAQRLFSRRTRAFIPMTKAMCVSKVELRVHRVLTQARRRGKAYYDKLARPLPTLRPGETVRMQTQRGYDRLATVLGPAPQPITNRLGLVMPRTPGTGAICFRCLRPMPVSRQRGTCLLPLRLPGRLAHNRQPWYQKWRGISSL